MSKEVHIRIFPLSSVEFEAGNLGKAIYWLMEKGDKPYYFREKTPRNFPAGSIALFNFESQIFGQAITCEHIRKFTSDEQRDNEARRGYPYKAAVRFVQSSYSLALMSFASIHLKKKLRRYSERTILAISLSLIGSSIKKF